MKGSWFIKLFFVLLAFSFLISLASGWDDDDSAFCGFCEIRDFFFYRDLINSPADGQLLSFNRECRIWPKQIISYIERQEKSPPHLA